MDDVSLTILLEGFVKNVNGGIRRFLIAQGTDI